MRKFLGKRVTEWSIAGRAIRTNAIQEDTRSNIVDLAHAPDPELEYHIAPANLLDSVAEDMIRFRIVVELLSILQNGSRCGSLNRATENSRWVKNVVRRKTNELEYTW